MHCIWYSIFLRLQCHCVCCVLSTVRKSEHHNNQEKTNLFYDYLLSKAWNKQRAEPHWATWKKQTNKKLFTQIVLQCWFVCLMHTFSSFCWLLNAVFFTVRLSRLKSKISRIVICGKSKQTTTTNRPNKPTNKAVKVRSTNT